MKVYRVPTINKDKESFRVPSSSEIGLYHGIDKLHTTANTYVYRCDCIGYMTRASKDANFECKHIKAVKEFELKEAKFNEKFD